jgi:hypothetical protein
MIMGVAAKVVPTLNGVDPGGLSSLKGPFLLTNVGCLLRVAMQPLTDWSPGVYPLLGISGTLEVMGLAWWGLGLVQILRRGRREADAWAAPRGPRPGRIEGRHCVAEILDWFPETESVFLDWGFTAIRQPLLRRTVARQVTIAQAAGLRGVALDELLGALNAAIAAHRPTLGSPRPDLPIIQIGVEP